MPRDLAIGPDRDRLRLRAGSSRRRGPGALGGARPRPCRAPASTGSAATRCAAGHSRSGTSRTSRLFWSGTESDYLRPVRRQPPRAVKVGRPDVPRRRPGDGRRGLDRRPPRARAGRPGPPVDFVTTHTYGMPPLDLRPIVAPLRPARTCRCGGPSGASARGTARRSTTAPWAAPLVARGMRSAAGRIEALAYWVASDHFVELGEAPALFHGGFGLLTIGNLRKPRFWALALLERLGEDELAASSTATAAGRSSRPGRPRIPTVGSRSRSGTGRSTSRRRTATCGLGRSVRLAVVGLPPGPYELRHHRVDADHSNIVRHLGDPRQAGLARRRRLGSAPGGRIASRPSIRRAGSSPTTGRSSWSSTCRCRRCRSSSSSPVDRRAARASAARRPGGRRSRRTLRQRRPACPIELLENGAVYAIRHGASSSTRCSAARSRADWATSGSDGARGPGSRPFHCSGPRRRAPFRATADGATWTGEVDGLAYLVHAPPRVPRGQPGPGRSSSATTRRRRLSVDALLAQDLGIADEGAVRASELYTSQYIDHTILDDEAFGYLHLLATEPAPGRGVSVGHARLPRRRGRVPDRRVPVLRPRLQGDERARRPSRRRTLPNRNYQYEFALPTLAVAGACRSRPGASGAITFFATFEADHPAATGPADARAGTSRRAMPSGRRPPATDRPSAGAGPAHGPDRRCSTRRRCSRATTSARPISSATSATAWRHVERRDGGAAGRSSTAASSTSSSRRRSSPWSVRPATSCGRAATCSPSDETLSVTAWMFGAFASHLDDRQHVVQQAPQRRPQPAQRPEVERPADRVPAHRRRRRAARPAVGVRDGPEQRPLDLPRRAPA